MDRWKPEQGRGREKRKIRRKKSRRKRVRRKKMQMREKVGKSRNTVFFPWFGAPEGRKVGSLKRRGAEPAGQMRDEKLHAVVVRSTFLKMYKTHHVRSTFGSWDVEKVHAVVARSTFPSQNLQNTPRSEHFWKLRCRKSARRCGAKHISKSNFTKHTTFGALLEVLKHVQLAVDPRSCPKMAMYCPYHWCFGFADVCGRPIYMWPSTSTEAQPEGLDTWDEGVKSHRTPMANSSVVPLVLVL